MKVASPAELPSREQIDPSPQLLDSVRVDIGDLVDTNQVRLEIVEAEMGLKEVLPLVHH
jgi:hypothetical protein